jgi:hypothetical protein
MTQYMGSQACITRAADNNTLHIAYLHHVIVLGDYFAINKPRDSGVSGNIHPISQIYTKYDSHKCIGLNRWPL